MAERDVDAVFRQRVGARVPAIRSAPPSPSGNGDSPISSSSLGIVDAVEVGMDQRKRRQVVALRQREGRARHFQRVVVGEIADHGARRGGLAGAEIAGQRDDVARRRSAARGRPSDARSRSRCASATENVVGAIIPRRCDARLVDREVAGHRRALADGRIDAHLAAMQFDEGAHQRQAEAGAAMPRSAADGSRTS